MGSTQNRPNRIQRVLLSSKCNLIACSCACLLKTKSQSLRVQQNLLQQEAIGISSQLRSRLFPGRAFFLSLYPCCDCPTPSTSPPPPSPPCVCLPWHKWKQPVTPPRDQKPSQGAYGGQKPPQAFRRHPPTLKPAESHDARAPFLSNATLLTQLAFHFGGIPMPRGSCPRGREASRPIPAEPSKYRERHLSAP